MKRIRKTVVLSIAALLVLTLVISLAACDKNKGNGKQTYDPETRPFSMSISTPDGVFNPFFSTSAYDSSILGMTQISMLNTDSEGDIVCGVNEPTVALDYSIEDIDDGAYTKYEFVIKNGIKFSDGEPLTIKDVLFNLYVYLDPVYTGSATIYSTDIVGLKQYRTQDDLSDAGQDSFNDSYIREAETRRQDVVQYVKSFGTGVASADKNTPPDWNGLEWNDLKFKEYREDIVEVANEFLHELTTDYNAINMVDYEKWHGFTAPWQIFMIQDGGVSDLLEKEPGGQKIKKDDDGNYYLDTAQAENFYAYNIEPLLPEGLNTNDTAALNNAIKAICIQNVFSGYVTLNHDLSGILDDGFTVKEADIDFTRLSAKEGGDNFYSVLYYWATAGEILQKWMADAKSKHFGEVELTYPTISGITTRKASTFNGKTLNGEHDVLTIMVNKVDPKAIYNFAFTVSPLHYYSQDNYEGVNYISDFNGDKGGTNFGVKFGSTDFMNNVLNATSKIGVPVGAGAYMASTSSGGRANSRSQFFDGSIVYYERNPYFWTVGSDGGSQESSALQNAKIKTVYYKVVETDQVINALKGGSIDFGEPNATPEHQREVIGEGLTAVLTTTAGYGYVGINPRFVPDINVRRAIMKAMDTSMVINNYYGNMASQILRPMTNTSWAYPKGATVYVSDNAPQGYTETGVEAGQVSYKYDQTGNEIEKLIKAAGYKDRGDGVYQRTGIGGFGTDTLDYKFTIAGSSDDHPAYNMFLNAAKILNAHGFNVQVVTSATALSDLSAGKLAVWAAAWSSTIDPDMYQVYHMDSQATSTNNWGYNYIIAGKTTEAYKYEYGVIQQLSQLIDEGRETTDQEERKIIYSDCLDLVMELAVEFPVYNRSDMSVFDANVLDTSTMPKYEGQGKETSPYYGVLSRIWELNYR